MKPIPVLLESDGILCATRLWNVLKDKMILVETGSSYLESSEAAFRLTTMSVCSEVRYNLYATSGWKISY